MGKLTLEQLLQDIQSNDVTERAAVRDNAGPLGAVAVAPLAKIAAAREYEVARAANRALQNIVDFAGRPGGEEDARAVTGELLGLLDESQPLQFRRDVLWMIWQIGSEDAAEAIAPLLNHADLKENARMALERLPGEKATAALQAVLAAADEADKPALAQSLRMRGIETQGVPDLRLKPTKETNVKPVEQ